MSDASLLGARFGPSNVQALLDSDGMAHAYHGFDHFLQHQHIVGVYAAVVEVGILYIAQKLLPDQTLKRRLRNPTQRQPLVPQADILTTTQQLVSTHNTAPTAEAIHRLVTDRSTLPDQQAPGQPARPAAILRYRLRPVVKQCAPDQSTQLWSAPQMLTAHDSRRLRPGRKSARTAHSACVCL